MKRLKLEIGFTKPHHTKAFIYEMSNALLVFPVILMFFLIPFIFEGHAAGYTMLAYMFYSMFCVPGGAFLIWLFYKFLLQEAGNSIGKQILCYLPGALWSYLTLSLAFSDL